METEQHASKKINGSMKKSKRKSQINNLTYHLHELEKEEKNYVQSQKKEGNNKD